MARSGPLYPLSELERPHSDDSFPASLVHDEPGPPVHGGGLGLEAACEERGVKQSGQGHDLGEVSLHLRRGPVLAGCQKFDKLVVAAAGETGEGGQIDAEECLGVGKRSGPKLAKTFSGFRLPGGFQVACDSVRGRAQDRREPASSRAYANGMGELSAVTFASATGRVMICDRPLFRFSSSAARASTVCRAFSIAAAAVTRLADGTAGAGGPMLFRRLVTSTPAKTLDDEAASGAGITPAFEGRPAANPRYAITPGPSCGRIRVRRS